MAHNLATINGKVAMVMHGERSDAWHNLGQRVKNAMTWQDAMTQAQLDWQVIKVQNQSVNPVTNVLSPVSSYSVFRSNDGAELASKVGEGFTIRQNSECFEFVDDLLNAENGAHYDSAGALGNGAVIWVSARIPDADISIGDDKHETYLVFTTAHDGTTAHTACLSSVRVVCQNTLNAALSSNSGILKIKHTKNAETRFQDARRVMKGITIDAQKLRDKFVLLAERRLTIETINDIFDRLFPKPKNGDGNMKRRDTLLSDILGLYENADNNAFPEQKGTAYNLLNAITEYTDHFKAIRMTEGRKNLSADIIRAENAVAGAGNTLKENALDVILAATQTAEVYAPLTFATV